MNREGVKYEQKVAVYYVLFVFFERIGSFVSSESWFWSYFCAQIKCACGPEVYRQLDRKGRFWKVTVSKVPVGNTSFLF